MKPGAENLDFVELRFLSKDDARLVVSGIQSLVDCPLGAAFRNGHLKAVILRGPLAWEPVLYFSRGARGAARLAGIRLPQNETTVELDQSKYVSLLTLPPKDADAARAPAERDSGPVRILVVEDHLDTASMLAELLKTWGFLPAIAHTGAEAMRVAADFRPRVVLLDLGLPDQHGYEVAERLRETDASGKVSFVVVTGWAQGAYLFEHSANAAISHHLVKPVDPHTLHTILQPFQSAERAAV
jgi:CheY-like chemotaxis protein